MHYRVAELPVDSRGSFEASEQPDGCSTMPAGTGTMAEFFASFLTVGMDEENEVELAAS